MIELGVNIDHVATLRQARRTHEPDPVWAAVEAHLGGADGITVHLREDRRHIQDEDVRRLRELVHIKLNLEMAATPRDARHRVQAEARDGDARAGRAVTRSPPKAVSTSPRRKQSSKAGGRAARRRRYRDIGVHRRGDAAGRGCGARIGARVCEIHTGPYAHAFHAKGRDPESAAVVARAERDPRGRRGRARARHALQCRPRAQLFQRAAGGRAARRARAAHRSRHRVALGVRRLARGGAADEGAAARSGRRARR